MLIPRYWSEARVRGRADDRQVTVRRFGWSLASQDEAQAHAEQRANDALARIIAGTDLPRREPKVPYNGAAGVPIREEILATHGSAVITRNAYGAQCLNTPDVLFADIDFVAGPRASTALLTIALGFLLPIAVGAGLHTFWVVLVGWLTAVLVGYAIAKLRSSLGVVERAAREHIDAFVSEHPDWQLRLYRTPAGLRVLAMHRTFDPSDPTVAEFFRAVRADPVYVQMCLRQQCFRARVTGKPWRMNIIEHLPPRPGVWPIAPERLPARSAWVARYEQRASAYASCRYLASLGSGFTSPQAEAVRALHDDLCRATSELPIA